MEDRSDPRSARRPDLRLLVALAICIAGLALACAIGSLSIAARPGARPLRLDSPPIGRHTYSIWVLPCDRFNPGQIIFGRDLYLFSRYPPPGLAIPLAPACP